MSDDPVHISSQEARGAEIILKKRGRRIIFIAGLVAAIGFAGLGAVLV